MKHREAALEVLQCLGPVTSRGGLQHVELFARLIDLQDLEVFEVLKEAQDPKCGVYTFWDLEEWLKPKITRRLLTALRGLVKEGLVEASWRGVEYICSGDGYPTKIRYYKLKA